jgi:WD40 repeat protein
LTLKGIQGTKITKVAFSVDGHFVGFSTQDEVTLWNAEAGEQLATLHSDSQAQHIQFSPTGQFLFTAVGKTGHLWDGRTGKQLVELKGHSDVITRIRFNKNEKLILTGADDGAAGVWDTVTGERLHKLEHGGKISTVGFSPNEKSILTASAIGRMEGSSVQVWDTATGKRTLELKHPSPVMASFRADGKQIVSVSGGAVISWDAGSGEELNRRTLKDLTYDQARFVPNGRHLITFHGRDAALWDLFGLELINKYKNVGDSVYDQFSSNLEPGFLHFYSYSRSKKGVWKWWAIEKWAGKDETDGGSPFRSKKKNAAGENERLSGERQADKEGAEPEGPRFQLHFVEPGNIEGVTGPGIKFDTGAKDPLVYMHIKPALVLQPSHVASIKMSSYEFAGTPSYSIDIELTDAARKQLAAVVEGKGDHMRHVMYVVDGKRRGGWQRYEINVKQPGGIPEICRADTFCPLFTASGKDEEEYVRQIVNALKPEESTSAPAPSEKATKTPTQEN